MPKTPSSDAAPAESGRRSRAETEALIAPYHDLLGTQPEDEIAAMLGANAAEWYGFDVEKLAPTVARIGPEKSAFRS